MCLNDVFSAIFAVKYLCVIALYWGENGGGEGRGRLKRGQCGGVCNFVILGLLVVVDVCCFISFKELCNPKVFWVVLTIVNLFQSV